MTHNRFFEGNHTAEFIVSMANGHRSVEIANVVVTDPTDAGTILEMSGTDYIPLSGPTATPAAILVTPATASEPEQTILVRDAEVLPSSLVYPDGATDAEKDTINTALGDELDVRVRPHGTIVT